MSAKDILHDDLSKGKIKQAIENLLFLTKSDKELHQSAIVISSRYENFLRDKHSGTSLDSTLSVEYNRICASILDLTNRLPEPSNSAPEKALINRSTIFAKFILPLFFISALALILKFILFNENTITSTVFVHDSNGSCEDIILSEGSVIMTIPAIGERKEEIIDQRGQAKFSGLHNGDKVRLQIKFSEPYRAMYPDSTYTISSNNSICLAVLLQNLDIIKGRVLSEDQPLSGVFVFINSSLKDTTDYLGNFTIKIPKEMRAKEQKLTAYKDGYFEQTITVFPQTNESIPFKLKRKNKQ